MSSRTSRIETPLMLVLLILCASVRTGSAEETTTLRVGVHWGERELGVDATAKDAPRAEFREIGRTFWSKLYIFRSDERSVHEFFVSSTLDCASIEGAVLVVVEGGAVTIEPRVLEMPSGVLELNVRTSPLDKNLHTIWAHPRLRWDCADIDARPKRPRVFAVDLEIRALARSVTIHETGVTLEAIAKEMAEPPGTQEEGYFAAKVFYATDRALENGVEVKFSGLRAENETMTYGVVEVSIPDSHEIGEIESPSWWKVWGRDDPSEYVLVLSTSKYAGKEEMATDVRALLSEAGREDVLVFVHGYNVAFDDAARRTAQLAYDLEFPGVPVLYSWPSRGEVDEYLADEASVEWTVPHFREFLRFVMTDLAAKDVHVIAHSMGNRALVRALSEFDVAALPPESARLRQVILAAPDVDAAVFRQLAANFGGKADRVTLYASKNDKAIKTSKTIHDYPRAGGEVVVVDGVDTIDASDVETDFMAHAYFGESIIPDLFAIIKNQLPPAQRFGLVQKTAPTGTYWALAKGAFE